MRDYIFITAEGFTYQPNSESIEPDIENCQVIGYGRGQRSSEAFEEMLNSQEHILKTTFNEVAAIELKNPKKDYFYLNDYKDIKSE